MPSHITRLVPSEDMRTEQRLAVSVDELRTASKFEAPAIVFIVTLPADTFVPSDLQILSAFFEVLVELGNVASPFVYRFAARYFDAEIFTQ